MRKLTRVLTEEDWSVKKSELEEAFSPGAPVQEKDLFAGRVSQIQLLESAVSQRGRHAILYGERGVGKTSLANILQLILRKPTRKIVYVRVNADPTDTFTSLWKKVFKRLSYVTTIDGNTIIKTIAEDSATDLSPDDIQLILSEFSESNTPVIVLDEFDRIKNEDTTQLIADTIKALSDYSVNATIILVGVAEDVSSLIKGHESITRCLVEIKMPRMSTDELRQLITTRYQRCGIETDSDAIWKMVFLSRGLPYYAQLLGMNAALFSISIRKLAVKHSDVDKALNIAISEVDQSIKEKYVIATSSMRGDGETLYPSVLLACAFAATDELGRFQQSAVTSPLNKIILGKSYMPSTFALHMNAFTTPERGSVLQRFGGVRNYRYRFTDPMMQPYVILKGLNEGLLTDEVADIFSTKPQMELWSSIN